MGPKITMQCAEWLIILDSLYGSSTNERKFLQSYLNQMEEPCQETFLTTVGYWSQ